MTVLVRQVRRVESDRDKSKSDLESIATVVIMSQVALWGQILPTSAGVRDVLGCSNPRTLASGQPLTSAKLFCDFSGTSSCKKH